MWYLLNLKRVVGGKTDQDSTLLAFRQWNNNRNNIRFKNLIEFVWHLNCKGTKDTSRVEESKELHLPEKKKYKWANHTI